MAITIHFYTDLEQPQLSKSDELIAAELRSRGHTVKAQPWETASPLIEIGIVRSTWNYPHYVQAFKEWLSKEKASGKTRFNDPELMLWNIHKSYLLDLEAAGLSIIPSKLMSEPKSADWHSIMAEFNYDVIVKPCVGNSGYGICRIKDADIGYAHDEAIIVQPFLEELATSEISFIFIEHEFSHAVRRIPADNDFRGNIAHGATVAGYTPSENEVQLAAEVLPLLPQRPFFSRIDGFFSNGKFYLNEVELIEPGLFFNIDNSNKAVKLFADRLLARIDDRMVSLDGVT